MNTTIRIAWALGAAATVIALSGCGNPGTAGPTTATPAVTDQPASPQATTSAPAQAAAPPADPATESAAVVKILIKDFKYQGPETVSPRAMITVTNEDNEAHTITADTGAAFDANIKPGTGTVTAPAEPGTYPYHCTFHGNMHGTLIVK